jgi:hypothetical protein
VLSAVLAACGGADAARVLPPAPGARALNEALALRLDGDVDPLFITPRSVRVVRPDGRELDCLRSVAEGSLVVELVVDEALLADPPGRVELLLAGAPSLHALATRDGRRLQAPVRAGFTLQPGLAASGDGPPRLVEPDERAAQDALATPLTLVFDGPLDPASLTPEACPTFPLAEGLALEPVWPEVRWNCVGQRFEVRLSWPRPHGELRLDLRRCAWRGLLGGTPEPAPRLRLQAAAAPAR